MTSSSPVTQRGLGGFLLGASYPLRALRLLSVTPHLRRYVLVPILLNLGIGITLYAGLLFAGLQAIDTFLTAVPVWLTPTPPLEIDWATWITALPHWQIALPNWFTLPTWVSWPSEIPTLNLPALPDWLPSLPDIQFPALQLPKITLPSWLINLPELGLVLLVWVLRILLVMILLLLTGFILLQFGVLLGAPWYGKLSEELEQLQTGQLQIIQINPVREIWRAILYELKKLAMTVLIGVPLLLSNFFPGPGTVLATTGGVTLAATVVCLDFLDSALERRRLAFRQKLGIILQSLPASAGFALVCLALVSIPFLNLLAIPVCVTAGTLFFCDQVLPRLTKTTANSK
jgi:CysZ protein